MMQIARNFLSPSLTALKNAVLSAQFVGENAEFSILQAWKPIAYAGIMSCGVGYTLQIVAQKNTDPTVASLLLSLESVFSVLAGWVILGETLSPRELFGCALVFVAVILAQLPERRPNLSCRDLQREESRPHHSTL